MEPPSDRSEASDETSHPASHETTIRVRYDEVDRMGVVHHGRYIAYLEVGRTEHLRAHGGCYRTLEDDGTLLMVVETGVRYLKPAFYDDLLVVRSRVAETGPVRLRFEYEILRGRDRIATAFTVLAACDRRGRPVRMPPEFKAGLEPAAGKAAGADGVQGE